MVRIGASVRTALHLLSALVALASGSSDERFSEHLVIRPVTAGHVELTFAFLASGSLSQHHSTFPPSIARILDTYPLQDFSLTLTRGRWDRSWGAATGSAAATGADLSANWRPSVTAAEVPALWEAFTNAVSGLFCASLNLLADTSKVATPRIHRTWDGRPWVASHLEHSALTGTAALEQQATLGMLSQEAVCTENLTAWLKLLPCRDDVGFAALLARGAVFGSPYHSFSVEAHLSASGVATLRQQISVVLPRRAAAQVLDKLRTAPFTACPVSASSTLSLFLPTPAAATLPTQLPGRCSMTAPHSDALQRRPPSGGTVGPEGAQCSAGGGECSAGDGDADVTGPPVAAVFCELQGAVQEPIDVALGPPPSEWQPWPAAAVHASQHVLGGGDERATWQLQLQRPAPKSPTPSQPSEPSGRPRPAAPALRVCTLTMVPWFLQLWLHTLAYRIDGVPAPASEVVEWLEVRPGEARASMHVLELCMRMPSAVTQITVTVALTKSLLYVHEYPPDPHRGFDLAATRVHSVPLQSEDPQAWRQAPACQGWTAAVEANSPSWLPQESEWLTGLACRPSVVQYTNSNLVSMATPDFSMPYNVCCLTCTLLAIFSVVVINLLTQRPRVLALAASDKSARRRKRVAQVCIMAGFACVAVYMDDDLKDWVKEQLGTLPFV